MGRVGIERKASIKRVFNKETEWIIGMYNLQVQYKTKHSWIIFEYQTNNGNNFNFQIDK